MHGHKSGDAALYTTWAPDGKTLAISANWGTPFFHLELLPMKNDAAAGKPRAVLRVPEDQRSPDGLGCLPAVRQLRRGLEHLPRRPGHTELHPLQSGVNPAWAPANPKP
jgi:hypothetical protein